MVTPIEPDGRGGVRRARTGRPVSEDRRAGVWGTARSVDRRADAAAKAAVRGALGADRWVGGAGLWAGRRLWAEADYQLRRGIGAGGARVEQGEGFFEGWANPPAWMRAGNPENFGRAARVLGELVSNTAGAVWSSVWRRGA